MDHAQLELFVAPGLEGFVGTALPAEPLLQVRLVAGAKLSGLRVELRGPAIEADCIAFEALIGFVPHGDERWEVQGQRRGDRLVYDFPEACLSLPPGGLLDRQSASGSSPHEIEARLLAENRASFAALPRGQAVCAWEGELEIRITAGEGADACSVTELLPLCIEAPARRPLLPPGAPQPGGDALTEQHLLALDAAYAAADYALLWLIFDGPRAALTPLLSGPLWRWAGRLAQLGVELADGLALPATLWVDGHERALPDAADEDGLQGPRWAEARAVVEAGGALRLDAGEGGFDPDEGYVLLSHAQLGDPLRSPTAKGDPSVSPPALELLCCWPQPDSDEACQRLSAIYSEVLAEATAEAFCISALATATGLPPAPGDPLVFELLAGLEGSARDARTLARRPRAAGWRVLVPSACAARLGPVHPLVRRRPVAAGTLVGSEASDPFSMDDEDQEAVEATLQHCFATDEHAGES